jgi:fructose-1-phosphate kinase PfkB-like protein
LKINAEELSLAADGETDAIKAGKALLARYKRLSWLAVTDGGKPAHLMSRNGVWRFKTPLLERVVSPIGGGDCATAIMARRLAEDSQADDMTMPGYFAEALACASASCLTDTPSVFEPSAAQDILRRTAVERL